MRKLILEFSPSELIRKAQKPTFEKIKSFEILEILRIDYEEEFKMGIMDIITIENIPIEELNLPENLEILNVLKSEDDKYTCLIKVRIPKEFELMLKENKLDVIWTTPSMLTADKQTYSCIGDQKNLLKFIDIMKTKGDIVNMRFQKAAYQQHDILSVLTDKQRELLIVAKKYGYYEYPRKISGQQLAQKVNISKPTLIQHLRKAEQRLMVNILSGYDTA
jgi:predicted DNA binding protein